MRHLSDERVNEQGRERVNLDLRLISTSSSFDRLDAKVCKSTYATKTMSDGVCMWVRRRPTYILIVQLSQLRVLSLSFGFTGQVSGFMSNNSYFTWPLHVTHMYMLAHAAHVAGAQMAKKNDGANIV